MSEETKVEETNVTPISAGCKATKPQAPSAEPQAKGPLLQVPQLAPDTFGLYCEPGLLVVTLATRFVPYQDGSLEPVPTATAVLRLHGQLARAMFTQGLKTLDEVEAKHAALLQQLTAKAALEAERKKSAAAQEKQDTATEAPGEP